MPTDSTRLEQARTVLLKAIHAAAKAAADDPHDDVAARNVATLTGAFRALGTTKPFSNSFIQGF